MLEPEDRLLLLDALRPPAGFDLDVAVGTTYSLDLTSLLAAPLGFALFDRESGDGRIIADPIALIEAVRRYADRISVFCQAGQIAIPPQYRAIFTYLESSVHEVVPPNADAIFHPKVWVIRYVRPTDHAVSYRLLCLSRNLTFDRAWDTMLRLDGELREPGSGDRRLAAFVRRLPELSVRPVDDAKRTRLTDMADELTAVVFEPPSGFDRVAFWPLGVDVARDPFGEARIDRLLVISPFLTATMTEALSRGGRGHILVSRPEALDLVGATAVARYAETLTLSATAFGTEGGSETEGPETPRVPVDEAVAERPDVELRGLHAKLYVADAPYRGRVWTGSANATNAAFDGNVEFLVELEGRKAVCGIDAVVGDRKDGVGLRKLLETYRPANEGPQALTPGEDLERRLDLTRRRLASQRYVARVAAADGDSFNLRLEITPRATATADWWHVTVGSATVSARPLTLGAAYLRKPDVDRMTATCDYGDGSFERLTSFFVLDVTIGEGNEEAQATFVVNAELVGAPEDRRQRTLVSLLENRKDLVRFLLLLLGQIGADDLSKAIDLEDWTETPGAGVWLFAQWNALFEPMVRALAADPARLDEIDRLVRELQSSETGRKLLPPGWREVWDPIWQARGELRTQ